MPLLMQNYSLLPILHHLVQSIVQMTQASATSLQGVFHSLIDLPPSLLIFILEVLLLNLVTSFFYGALKGNRMVEV